MAIKCITFDLDDTLWDSGPVLASAERKFYEWLVARCPDIVGQHPYDDLVEQRRRFYLGLPEMRHDFTFLRKRWLADLGDRWGYGDALIEPGFAVFWHARNDVVLFDGVVSLLQRLKSRYRIGAITNGNA